VTGAGEAPLRVVRLDLTFDGTDFRGWQRQKEGRTVQAVVEGALERLLGAQHAVVASGRLDAGTHASMLVVSFRTSHAMPAAVLARALDAVLPEDVGVLDASDAAPGFHARRAAAWKWYRYTLLRTRGKRPLWRRTAWHRSGPLDARALAEGAAALVGRHDFLSFAAAGPLRGGSVRTLHALRWSEERLPLERTDLLHLDAVGEGFLHHMVRNVVGTLVQCASPDGGGADRVRAALAARDRRAAGPTAPAHGLRLVAVGAAGEPLPLPEQRTVESGDRAPASDRTGPSAPRPASPPGGYPPTRGGTTRPADGDRDGARPPRTLGRPP
jgi:tRNA pseudouridine38-40 synthase